MSEWSPSESGESLILPSGNVVSVAADFSSEDFQIAVRKNGRLIAWAGVHATLIVAKRAAVALGETLE